MRRGTRGNVRSISGLPTSPPRKDQTQDAHLKICCHRACRTTALELYGSYQFKIMECDQQAEKALAAFEPKVRVPAPI
jgi:hypothetical protein